MDRYIEQASDNLTVLNYWKLHSNLKCFECDSYFDDDKIIKSGNSKYIKFSRNVIKSITSLEIQSTSMKKEQENYVSVIKNEIREELTKCISCPHCYTAFVDFQGCLALHCSNCKKGFCGICCKKHISHIDNHDMVRSHTSSFSPEFKRKYKFTDSYFISESGWLLWKDKLKTEAVIAYLSKIRTEIIWSSINEILFMLKTEELLSSEGINNIKIAVYSGGLTFGEQNIHLVRIPIVFWTIYSYKKDRKFEEVVATYKISTDEKIKIGMILKNKILAKYPHFETIKHKVPGEVYEAINYPIEMSPLIFEVIEEWGRTMHIW
jgi:hypothetical protein